MSDHEGIGVIISSLVMYAISITILGWVAVNFIRATSIFIENGGC